MCQGSKLPFATAVGTDDEETLARFTLQPGKARIEIALNVHRANNGQVVDIIETITGQLVLFLVQWQVSWEERVAIDRRLTSLL